VQKIQEDLEIEGKQLGTGRRRRKGRRTTRRRKRRREKTWNGRNAST
jgi:hypothetical protein